MTNSFFFCFNLIIGMFFIHTLTAQPLVSYHLYNKTPTYDEVIAFYKNLDSLSTSAKLIDYGPSDAGRHLYLFVISNDGDFDPVSIKKKGKSIIFVNNGIHPGEPDGVNASLILANNFLNDNNNSINLAKVVLCIIPIYNVGGALNRNCCSRANQNGPEEYGFRGNYQNLDLNRDFIKMDARNTEIFTKMYHEWDPDIFIDTHTTDGADYPYTMTLIPTQHNKLNPVLSDYMKNKMTPFLYRRMKNFGFEMFPYVQPLHEIPDSGIIGFFESPRYSTGFTTLFNSFGYTTESHMLKSFKNRVEATYNFLVSMVEFCFVESSIIINLRQKAKNETMHQTEFPLVWRHDTTNFEKILFKGYEASYKSYSIAPSFLFYDRSKPFEKKISFFNSYNPSTIVHSPLYYVIPQAWDEVIERLVLNGVKIKRLSKDTTLSVEIYYVTSYETIKKPYEGHYLHYNVKVRSEKQEIKYFKGDIIILLNQESNRFIVETLEPEGTDSYFCWNFFDAVLQQKEWYSDYVFIEIVERILVENQLLKIEFENKLKEDTEFAQNIKEKLKFIYERSPYFEKSYNRYPVARGFMEGELPLD